MNKTHRHRLTLNGTALLDRHKGLTEGDDHEDHGIVANVFQTMRVQTERVSIRFEKLEGRDYMVMPMVMLTEGVHAGSNGPLLYPSAELAKTPAVWNHKPIVVYHPTENGQAISACEPAVISRRKVGIIMNTKYIPPSRGNVGKLRAEAWLETNRLKAVDDRVLDAINKGSMVEVSTGLFTDNEQTEGTWNKEHYDCIARNYRPDHLAILPDEVGACSVKDGAGLLRNAAGADMPDLAHAYLCYPENGKLYKRDYSVNAEGEATLSGEPVEVDIFEHTSNGANTKGASAMKTRKQMVGDLIANANTHWEEGDREYLMSVEPEQLAKMLPVANEDGAYKAPTGKVPMTATDGKDCDNADELEDAAGQVKGKKPGSKSGKADNKFDDVNKGGQMKTAKDTEEDEDDAKPKQNQSVEEYCANAPEGVREVLMSGLQTLNTQKAQLITKITANKGNRFTKEWLATRGLEELQALASLAGAGGSPAVNRTPMYFGQGDALGLTQNADATVEALPIPRLTFERKQV